VVIIDSNDSNIKIAKQEGLEAFTANIYSDSLADNIELSDIGYLMSLTGNSEINKYAINKFEKQYGENGAYRLITPSEMKELNNNPEQGLFSHIDDFDSVSKVASLFPMIHELELEGRVHYDALIHKTEADKNSIPLFIKDAEGELRIISSYNKDIEDVAKGFKLVYLGKMLTE
ncbi:MAG: hypothetical protein ACI86C_000144, partial [Candidatus Latescibacterota bacterium]